MGAAPKLERPTAAGVWAPCARCDQTGNEVRFQHPAYRCCHDCGGLGWRSDDARRLYGLPGDERLGTDRDEVAREAAEQWLRPGEQFVVEEWDTHPPLYHLPSPEDVAEWIVGQAADRELDELGADHYLRVARGPEVMGLVRRALDALAGGVEYRMARRHLASHVFSVPYGDGPPVPLRVERHVELEEANDGR